MLHADPLTRIFHSSSAALCLPLILLCFAAAHFPQFLVCSSNNSQPSRENQGEPEIWKDNWLKSTFADVYVYPLLKMEELLIFSKVMLYSLPFPHLMALGWPWVKQPSGTPFQLL